MRNYLPILALVLTSCGTASSPKKEPDDKLTQSPLGGASGIVAPNASVPNSDPFDLLSGAPAGAGSASSIGTVQGAAIAPTTAFFDALALQNGQAAQPVFAVALLSTRADACSIALDDGIAANDTSIALFLRPAADANAPTESLQQTYPVTDPNAPATTSRSVASLMQLDGTCKPTLQAFGASGQVNVQNIAFTEPASAEGQFTVIFGSAEENLTGGFNAAPCPGLAAVYAARLSGGGGPLKCVP